MALAYTVITDCMRMAIWVAMVAALVELTVAGAIYVSVVAPSAHRWALGKCRCGGVSGCSSACRFSAVLSSNSLGSFIAAIDR